MRLVAILAAQQIELLRRLDAFRRHDVSTMIHGHTHRLASHYYDVDGRKCVRHVLGDWQESMNGGNYLACSTDGWQRGQWWPEAE